MIVLGAPESLERCFADQRLRIGLSERNQICQYVRIIQRRAFDRRTSDYVLLVVQCRAKRDVRLRPADARQRYDCRGPNVGTFPALHHWHEIWNRGG